MKVSVIGTGYVGLVTAVCLAELGNTVVGIDADEVKVKTLKSGRVPAYEPQLEELLKRNLAEHRLRFTTQLKDAVGTTEIIFLALPTPAKKDGSADLSIILHVAKQLGGLLERYTVIVTKSTVPVGMAEKIREVVGQNTKVSFDIVSNPEFLREGLAVDDFLNPDRIVIGVSSGQAIEKMKELYEPLLRRDCPLLIMDERSAEMTKYAANAFLATKISFINEVANLCEQVGADVDQVRAGIGTDERIGHHFLFAGIGFGGSCFPKDVRALYSIAKHYGYNFKILQSVREVNDAQKDTLLHKVLDYFKGNLKGKTMALWGLAFKPDTDDIREAPSLQLIRGLLDQGATVRASDPQAIDNVKRTLKHKRLQFNHDHFAVLAGADALLIATEWAVFQSPNFKQMRKLLKTPVIFDGRNLYKPHEMKTHGFYYASVGRPTVKP